MDRRRFKPSAEGLEGRALLSLFGGSSSASSKQTVTLQDEPGSIALKNQRIDRLPYYLEQTQPGRVLPAPLMSQLQTDMRAVLGQLHAPTTPVVEAFNADLRHTYPHTTVSQSTAKILNHAFGEVLNRAGATAEQQARLQEDLNELVRVDVNSRNPSILVANDYAIILQTTLAIGRPVQTPTAPVLSSADGTIVKGGVGGTTTRRQPQMVGSYNVGASPNGLVQMQIVDQNGHIYGSAPVDAKGRYSVTIATPLPDGTYKLSARSLDEGVYYSKPSKPFTLKVVSPPAQTTVTTTSTLTVSPRGILGG